jgi:hypothetical protein
MYRSRKRILFNLRAEERSLSRYVQAQAVLYHAPMRGGDYRRARNYPRWKRNGEPSMREIRESVGTSSELDDPLFIPDA